MLFGALAILQAGKGIEEANIHNIGDALWWAFVMVTTVGYGDFYPVSLIDRLISIFLMITGVGLFAMFTAEVVKRFFFTDQPDTTAQDYEALQQELTEINRELVILSKRLT
ncbi:potassium channel family protein [Flexibacterium corallicola]|uniref:potassium channel family protein n=1 Tax=Flexibacterium corallicola TaxID=3037259 RepID=UPI00286F51B1|nr:potassium channel family protein [Pseudovibrio sp. M1P-2-3]